MAYVSQPFIIRTDLFGCSVSRIGFISNNKIILTGSRILFRNLSFLNRQKCATRDYILVSTQRKSMWTEWLVLRTKLSTHLLGRSPCVNVVQCPDDLLKSTVDVGETGLKEERLGNNSRILGRIADSMSSNCGKNQVLIDFLNELQYSTVPCADQRRWNRPAPSCVWWEVFCEDWVLFVGIDFSRWLIGRTSAFYCGPS